MALDTRSQGRSGKPTEEHHHIRRGKDIGELVEYLDAGPAVVVGWSLAVREILTYAKEFGKKSQGEPECFVFCPWKVG